MRITANKGTLTSYKEVSRDGREYVVVSGVAIVEGILNDRFVSKNEFAAFVEDWNGVPVVLRHPKENNGTARVPVPDVPVIGRFYDARLDGDRLIGDYWIEKTALLSTPEGSMIYSNIKANRPTEVSTAYYSNTTPEIGEYNGKDYHYVDRDLHPDHIAILPDEIGACSVKAGCGLSRNSATGCDCQTVYINVTGDLPSEGKKQWEAVYKSALKDGDDEETAAKKAWGAIKASGWYEDDDGKWKMRSNSADGEMVEISHMFVNFVVCEVQ